MHSPLSYHYSLSFSFFWNSLWRVLFRTKVWILSCIFFPLYLTFFWEIVLTVTYTHNSSYVLFMAFQQLCNPRGWKYFPFATATRAAERKYEQLQASLIMRSKTLLGILVYHFSLKEKAGYLFRHLNERLRKDRHTLHQKWVLQNETSLHCLDERLSPVQKSAYFNHLLLNKTYWF